MNDAKKECRGNCPTCRSIRASRKKDRGRVLVGALLVACLGVAGVLMYLGIAVQP